MVATWKPASTKGTPPRAQRKAADENLAKSLAERRRRAIG